MQSTEKGDALGRFQDASVIPGGSGGLGRTGGGVAGAGVLCSPINCSPEFSLRIVRSGHG
jgi:hypothetical protein